MHFVIWVTNTDNWSLEDQMEPYYQDTDNPKYLEKEIMLKGDKESVKKYVDNVIANTEEQVKYWEEQKKDSVTVQNNSDWYKGKLKDWKSLKKTLETDFKLAKSMIAEYEYWDIDKNGDFYEEYNHNMEWDWYVVGGRWDNNWVTKDGKATNVFKKGDLDLEKTRQKRIEDYTKYYNEQIERGKKEGWPEKNWVWGYETCPTLEKYLKDQITDTFWIPYGYLDDEQWVNENYIDLNEGTWEEQFQEWFNNLPDDTQITVVDYHM